MPAFREVSFTKYEVNNDIPFLTGFIEVSFDVINHPIRAERFHKLNICAAADSGNFRFKIVNELNSESSDTAGYAVHRCSAHFDENFVNLCFWFLDLSQPQNLRMSELFTDRCLHFILQVIYVRKIQR